jgi:hypothetical protein
LKIPTQTRDWILALLLEAGMQDAAGNMPHPCLSIQGISFAEHRFLIFSPFEKASSLYINLSTSNMGMGHLIHAALLARKKRKEQKQRHVVCGG